MKYLIASLRIAFGIVMALLVVELLFRAVVPSGKRQGWSDRPGRFYIPENARTLQDRSYTPQKEEGKIRIIAVGDSFTFAPVMQWDDAYPKRLERWLNLNNSQPAVEVLNKGVPGFSTLHEVEQVKRAFEQNSDLVILEITLNDAELRPMTADEQKQLYGAPFLKNPIFKWWRSGGYFLQRLHNTKTHSLYKNYFNGLYENPETFSRFQQSLRDIRDIRDNNKRPVLAVIFPLFTFPLDDHYPFETIHKKIRSELEVNGIPYIDLLPFYKGIPNEHLQIIPGKDTHPNEIAHRIAAEAIYSWLEGLNVLPTEIFARRVYNRRKDLISKRVKGNLVPK